MIDWIAQHVWETAVLVALGGSTLIQISPIKVNPWSALAKSIGRAINNEMMAEISSIRAEVSNVRKELYEYKKENEDRFSLEDERYAKQCRMRILRFNDEILQADPQKSAHSKEHYDEILDDVTEYERYCETHPGYRNSKAVMAIQNVERSYQTHMANKSFL